MRATKAKTPVKRPCLVGKATFTLSAWPCVERRT